MSRLAIIFLAAAAVTAPAVAGTYSARPAVAPDAARIVGKDIVWTCAGTACQGATEYGRSLVICQNLAKKAGRIESFAVDGQAIAAAELAKCNSAAKAINSAAIANAN